MSGENVIEALRMFYAGMKEREPFAFVNMALTFALRIGTDQDWHLADDIMKRLPDTDTANIRSRWADVARKGDPEGVLVHYFLLRHKKLDKSELGSAAALSKRLSAEIENFPDWLQTEPRFSSLEDVFETLLDDDFEDSLSTYIDEMPRNRKSAEELLYEITQWDEWLLYCSLLQDFRPFLTKEEIEKVAAEYKKKFSVPLSTIADIDDLESDGEEDNQEDQHG